MDWLQLFATWIWDHPVERVFLCAETVALVMGVPWAWFTWRSMKRLQRANNARLRKNHNEVMTALRRMPGLIGYDEASGFALFGTKHGTIEVHFHDPATAARQIGDWLREHNLVAPIDAKPDE